LIKANTISTLPEREAELLQTKEFLEAEDMTYQDDYPSEDLETVLQAFKKGIKEVAQKKQALQKEVETAL